MAERKPVVLVGGVLKEMPSGDALPAANIPDVTAANIHAAPSKATPVDADELGLSDSAASWGLKKLTFANLKAWLSGLYVGKTGAQVIAGDLTVPSLNGGQLAGLRNKIINGKMEIAQRGTSFISPASLTYTLDRWVFGIAGTGAVTVSQQADAPSDNEFQNSLRYTVTTADASIAAGDALLLSQRIEGYNARDLIGRTFTLSFWACSSKTGIHCVAFRNSGADRSYVLEYTVNAANTWEKKSVTLSGGLITAGTWDWTTGVGLTVFFTAAVGSTLQTTAGAWQTGNFQATANQVNCLDTIGNIFAITGVQLEVGSVATPFEHRPYGMELALAQRYFERSNFINGGAGVVGFNVAVTAAASYLATPFRVEKRVVPTFTPSFFTGTGATFKVTSGGFYQDTGHSVISTYSWTAAAEL